MHESPRVLLSGRIVLADGGARQRYVLVEDGRVRWISRGRPPAALADGALEVTTGPQDWIFPGLIDLHTHTWYNLLPLWSSPRAPFDNRYVWRSDPGYKAAIGGTLDQLGGDGYRARKVFSELQSVAGGTTVLDEPRPLDSGPGEGATLLCRDTGTPRDLGLEDDRTIASVVDFFKPDENGRPAPAPGRDGKPGKLDLYVAERDARQATLVHLAEGRSGFGSYRGPDPYSRAEFEAFMAHPALADAEAVRRSRLSLVHGCGIDVDDPRHVDFLVERGISIIWSPVSNLLLYGDTLDAETLIQRGLNVALGSDWSPSGSKHVWDEAKFARFFLRATGSNVSDADVFQMVTTRAGRCLGLPGLGRIEEGAFADFFILRSPIESDSALEVFYSTTDRDVLATVVHGLPIYGDREFLSRFGVATQPLPPREGSSVENKVVHLPASVGVNDFAGEISAVEDRLKALDPPVLRSNLLASSDVPYRRRIQRLRSRAERFGWSVRQRRRKGPSPTPGRVPVAAGAARIHVGFAAPGRRVELVEALGASILPARVALGSGAGLTACFSALPPDDAPDACPHELSLAFYESVDVLERSAARTVADRAAGLVEDALLDRERSWSRPAIPYARTVTADTAYHLLDHAVDWHHGDVRVTLLVAETIDGFHESVRALLDRLTADPGARDGLLAIVGDGYVALWEHAPSGMLPESAPTLEATRAILSTRARSVDVKAELHEPWPGLPIEPGECLRADFERRALFPW